MDRGDLVVKSDVRDGSAWPAVTVWVYIDATPEQSAAIFTDVEAHATYITSLTRSRISRVLDSVTMEVDYTLAVPIVSDEDYTVRDRIGRNGDRYRVDWNLVRASSTKATVGHAVFAPHTNARTGRAGTLLEYFNFVTPGSRLAGMAFIRNRAGDQVRETAADIAKHVEATKHTAAAAARVAMLKRIVGTPNGAVTPR